MSLSHTIHAVYIAVPLNIRSAERIYNGSIVTLCVLRTYVLNLLPQLSEPFSQAQIMCL